MASYPKDREPYFAHKIVRLMIRVCAAQEIGTDACVLVWAVAHTEDAKRYRGPVTWWNDQLRSVLGFTSWGKLDRARKRAIDSGWLHYEPGGKGKVGKYWATVPDQFTDIPNGAVDEDHPVILSTSGERTGGETPLSSPPVVKEPGDNRGTSGDLSSLTLNPKNRYVPVSAKTFFSSVTDDKLRDDAEMMGLFMQATRLGVVPDSEETRLNFWGAACHALRKAGNPAAMFVSIVRDGTWRYITAEDQDRSQERLKAIHRER